MSVAAQRIDMLDAMRLAAAIGVLFIHVSFTPQISPDAGEFLRFLMRWAVPFFFLLTGYFLKKSDGLPVITADRLRRILVIALVANAAFLPLVIVSNGVSALSVETVASGTWFHLWFLSSLIFGTLTLMILPVAGLSPHIITISAIGFTALALSVDMLSSFHREYIPVARLLRFAMAGPLIWIGFSLAGRRQQAPDSSFAICLIGAGILFSFLETLFYAHIGVSIFDRQYSLGAFAVAIGTIIWAGKTTCRPGSWLAKIGRDYSLTIYIVHPIFLKVAILAFGQIISPERIAYWQVFFGAVFSVATAYVVDRYLPPVANLLRGELPNFRNRSGA